MPAEGAIRIRILITGGAGYLGRTLTRTLAHQHEIAIVDTLRHGRDRFTDADRATFTLFETDICDYAALAQVFATVEPELILHLAAIHYIPECEANPDLAVSVNTLGTVNVLRACPPESRLVFISTAAVYAPESTPHTEEHSLVRPMDIYGLTKLHAEQYVQYWSGEKRLRAAIIRMFNIIGPGETNPHLVPAILAQLLRRERRLGLGNCHPRRDYIDVSDAAAGVTQVALQLNDAPGIDIVNIGTGVSHSVYDVVAGFEQVIGEPIVITTDAARVRAVDRPMLAASIAKARRDYGWSPALNLHDSLRRLWNEPDIPASLLARA